MENQKFQAYFFVSILIMVLVISAFIFLPYLSTIALAVVFAIIFAPVFERLKKNIGDGGALSALLTTVIAVLVAVIPFFIVGFLVFEEAGGLYSVVISGKGTSFEMLNKVNYFMADKFPGVNINIWEYIKEGLRWFLSSAGAIFSGVTNGIITLLLSFLTMYYFLKDGENIKKYLISISPLSDRDDKQVFDKLQVAVKSVIVGSLTIALIQGTLAGIGFSLFNVPSPAFWGALTVFAALIPSVGTSLVIIPTILYLFLSGNFANGIGLLIWGGTIVALIDNVLSPKILQKKMDIHPVLILFSVLGGLSFFGIMGFIIGPLIISLLAALVNIYQTEFKDYFEGKA